MWAVFAILASLLWGVTYALGEQIYKKISVITSLSLATFISGFVMLAVACATGFLKRDIKTLATDRRILGFSVAEAICLMGAELLLGFSITSKNATISSLIEISYPIFVAVFSFLLFKEEQINLASIIGGLAIFSGVFIIYYFNH